MTNKIDEKGFSIAICTYNRPRLLDQCLASLVKQSTLPSNLEIWVIDNAHDPKTKEVVIQYKTLLPQLHYEVETQVGLSHARNKALQVASYDWVCYLDDDAKAAKNFVERMFWIREQYDFDAFGGMFYPWYEGEKPKWLPDWFGQFKMHLEQIGTLDEGKFFAGGICAFNKQKLIEIDMFPTDIGMRGDVIGYGEEDYVQVKLREKGAKLGFDPNWTIDHLVADYKQTVSWHLKRSFAKGFDSQKIKGSLSFTSKLKLKLRAIFSALFHFIKFSPRLLFSKHYYWQNYILDSLRHSMRMWGKAAV
jgi:glucosyl-dolichyl phosphate glucuronosyltransferase